MQKVFLSAAVVLLLSCSHSPTSKEGSSGFRVCSGDLSSRRASLELKRSILRGCVADDAKGLELKLVEKGADGATFVRVGKNPQKKVEGNELVYTASSEDGVQQYELRLTPEHATNPRGSMRDSFEGKLKVVSNGKTLHEIPGIHFYTETPDPHLHWTYQGDTGPHRWGMLLPEFETCGEGKRQSPINVPAGAAKPSSMGSLKFSYKPSRISLVNNGHALQANVESGNFLTVDGKRYQLLQFHAHAPSEHLMEGKDFELELHFVHQAEDKSLAVVGVLVKTSKKAKASDILKTILKEFSSEVNDPRELSVALSPEKLLPPKHSYLSYPGSLTTPPCSETVTWFVLRDAVTISEAQAGQAKRILGGVNARRPVAELGDRVLLKGE